MRSVDVQPFIVQAPQSTIDRATVPLPTLKPEPAAPEQMRSAPAQLEEPMAAPPLQRMFRPQAEPVASSPAPAENQVAPVTDSAVASEATTTVADAEPSVSTPSEVPAATSAPASVQPAPLPAPAPRASQLQMWPADTSQGAAGRVVRIGTYSTRLQAKRAWWKLVRVYPGVRRLNAVVSPVQSLRNGRTYYRLQFGTTSQAHSAVLCQRMRIVGQSCVVVGA
jgi:hypothetical protein